MRRIASPLQERGQREADSSLASGVGDMRLKSVLGNSTEGDSGAVLRPVGGDWLSIDAGDRLPEIGHTVLCLHRDAPTCGLWKRRNDEAWEWANVSHWMPLLGRPLE